MNQPHPITKAQPADAAWLADLVASAFLPLAPSTWLIQDPRERREIFPGYFRILVEHALAYGSIDTIGQRAAALWVTVGSKGPTAPANYDQRLKDAVGAHLERFEILDEQFDAHHPTGVRHQHLAILAVDPCHQRQGLGRALLLDRHRVLDERGTPAYLEASDQANQDWYHRHGYRDHGDPLALPDGPFMYPMMRPPGTC